MSIDREVYTLLVKKQRVEVSKEVYKAYYECREREIYLEKLSRKYDISFEELEEEGFVVEENSRDISKETAEEVALKNILIQQIEESLHLLNEDELFLIKEIFEKGVSERNVAKRLGIPRMTLKYQIERVIEKIKILNKF